MEERYQLQTAPKCNPKNVVQGENYRFTILTPQLIRLEYCSENRFEDHATQTVINRDFPEVPFRVIDKQNSLEIITQSIRLNYNKKNFSKTGLSIETLGNFSNYGNVWRYSEEFDDLRGTARTLDNTGGPIPLEHGIISANGFSVLDDSSSLTLLDDGWVAPRETEETDLYFFGYGRNYLQCLKDFFHLCGKTPMLPRFALGNWWSRYNRYTEGTYKELMQRFEQEKIPFSVAVLDMDWHLVDVGPENGSGWTGYTWNRKLFPNPAGFLKWLHDRNLKVSLNLHPANGVMPYEDAYKEMAEELGVKNGDKIDFDITDRKFLSAYFKYLHHPHEKAGVDFWWVDWQQGSCSKLDGMDPLWMLNHYHFLDLKRNQKRPLILSRYAGAGSHRYPIGFSGDSIICWDALNFQPYFTANASNIGYGWWSHDIGGHMCGTKDDELAVRWIQFGVFSPINRLHSSSGPFNGKEPWHYNPEANLVIKKFLQLRHQLVPYLYTMNYRFHHDDLPLIQPMYYQNPYNYEAYNVPNEYYFGSELIACPITTPSNQKLGIAQVKVWLPEGNWIDFFTGMAYRGNRIMSCYRPLSNFPAFAKAGAIIPMTRLTNEINAVSNPVNMDFLVFAGKDNTFTLYEDDDADERTASAVFTDLAFHWDKQSIFSIHAAKGNSGMIPEKRNYTVRFRGFSDSGNIQVTQNGEDIPFNKTYETGTHTINIKLTDCLTNSDLKITIGTDGKIKGNDTKTLIYNLLDRAQIKYNLKNTIYNIICSESDLTRIFSILLTFNLPKDLYSALCEILAA